MALEVEATLKEGADGRTAEGETKKKEENAQAVAEKVESSGGTEAERKTVFHLVLKFPSVDPLTREMNHRFKTDLTEYLMYSEVIQELNKFKTAHVPEEPEISIPRLLFGKYTDKASVLVMDNIKVLGYDSSDKRKGLDREHLKMALDQLARLHALSYAHIKSTSDSKKKYEWLRCTQEYMKRFALMVGAMMECSVRYLKTREDVGDVAKRYEANMSSLLQQAIASLASTEHTIQCLVHGDFWNNNFMFRYKDSDSTQAASSRAVDGIKVIDWGNCSIGTPFYDLQYVIYTSTTEEVRRNHLEEVLQEYHNTFTTLSAQVGVPCTEWTYEKFKVEWDKTSAAGFLLGCALTLGTLSTKNNFNKKPEPSVLDKSYMMPLKFVADGLKTGMAKMMVPLLMSSSGQSLTKPFLKKMLQPISEELLSGENEIMNKRLLDLVHEADKKGLFNN